MSISVALYSLSLCAMLLLLCVTKLQAQSLQLSGGLDTRFTNERVESSNEKDRSNFRPRLEGAFLNLRKIWSDEYGDRWIGVAQADFDDNLQRIRPYQAYLQYKGPLGKWNVRAGHYLLPFGLLSTYDTERLVLQGLEKLSLGIRKDTGVEAFGRYGSWDYAVSLSDGLNDVRLFDARANPVITARVAYVRGDAQLGFSTLVGRVLLDPQFNPSQQDARERRFAVDATKSFGPLTLRAEGIGGTDNGHAVGGGVFLGDYALNPKLELNTRYSYWDRTDTGHGAGIGLTFQLRQGLFFRTATTFQSKRNDHYGVTLQLYYEFSKLL